MTLRFFWIIKTNTEWSEREENKRKEEELSFSWNRNLRQIFHEFHRIIIFQHFFLIYSVARLLAHNNQSMTCLSGGGEGRKRKSKKYFSHFLFIIFRLPFDVVSIYFRFAGLKKLFLRSSSLSAVRENRMKYDFDNIFHPLSLVIEPKIKEKL